MIPDALQSELDRLASLLLPEHQSGIYWLDTAELPTDRVLDRCWGFTGRHADVSCREAIGDRWTGRKPCVALALDRIERALREGDAYFSPELLTLALTGYVTGVAIHEVGHIADDGFDTRPITDGLATYADASHEFSVNYYAADLDFASGKPPWYLHGPHWLRVVTHAAHRAQVAGFQFPDASVWVRDNNVCPLLHTARATCFDELTTLAQVPLSDLIVYRPSDDYAGLWRCKTSRWRSTRPADDHDADRHVQSALSYFPAKDITQ